MVKRLGALRPTDDEGTEAIQKIKDGSLVKISWTTPRNARLLRKLFVMLTIILDNQNHYKSTRDLLDVCKLRVGHVRIVETARGIEKFPASISFVNMPDNAEFDVFYNKAVDWMLSEVIPGLQRQHLDAEVEDQLIGFAA